MEFLADYGLFLAKAVTLVLAVLVVVMGIASSSAKLKRLEKKGHIEVEKLNEKYEEMKHTLTASVLPEQAQKDLLKEEKKQHKEKKKQEKNQTEDAAKKRVFVVDFHGDIKASEAEGLEQVVSAVLMVAKGTDEVVVRLESQGGMVHSYGYAASQLARIRSREIPLTICIDKVAASGGYMMACIGDKILAAPFSIIGSIGVVAQIPNVHRLLKKHDIDYELITAGEYKRTLTVFGENTEKGREKFQEDIQDTHDLFKEYVSEHRSQVNIEEVSTGEVWFGSRALDKALVDEIKTSEEYLLDASNERDIYKVEFVEKRSLQEKLGIAVRHGVGEALETLLLKGRDFRFFN